MNIVNAGNNYQVYSEALKVYKKLPAGVYEVTFSQMSGFSLMAHSPLEVKEEKIYGDTSRKVEKILRGFEMTNRNFGVILSGAKGIGKSLLARILSIEAQKKELPVILVNYYIPGIAGFLQSIDQEAVVFFDEFEKTFSDKEDNNPQEEMLSLFDGVDCGKKLFVITCNDVVDLNEFFLNRPGRFHYHFIMNPPTPEEVKEYMTDKLLPKYHEEIDKIVSFSTCTTLTYDILRAISFEINLGYSLNETLNDLNISKENNKIFTIRVKLKDGTYAEENKRINLLSTSSDNIWFYDMVRKRSFCIRYVPAKMKLNLSSGGMSLDFKDATVSWDSGEEYSEDPIELQSLEFIPVNYGSFSEKYLI